MIGLLQTLALCKSGRTAVSGQSVVVAEGFTAAQCDAVGRTRREAGLAYGGPLSRTWQRPAVGPVVPWRGCTEGRGDPRAWTQREQV